MLYLLKILGKAIQLCKEGLPLRIHMSSMCAVCETICAWWRRRRGLGGAGRWGGWK